MAMSWLALHEPTWAISVLFFTGFERRLSSSTTVATAWSMPR
jgi:hypothetical protein